MKSSNQWVEHNRLSSVLRESCNVRPTSCILQTSWYKRSKPLLRHHLHQHQNTLQYFRPLRYFKYPCLFSGSCHFYINRAMWVILDTRLSPSELFCILTTSVFLSFRTKYCTSQFMETVVERDNVGKKNSFNAKTKRGLQTVEPGKGLKSKTRMQIYIFHW